MLQTLSSRGFYFWFACYKVICMISSPVPFVIPCPILNFLVLLTCMEWYTQEPKIFVNCTNHAVMLNPHVWVVLDSS